MSWIDKLTGSSVESVEIGVANLTLRVSKDGREYTLSSGADVALGKDSPPVDFRGQSEGRNIAHILNNRLEALSVASDESSADLTFANGSTVRAFWPDSPIDNLFVVREVGSEEWGVIG